jgi:hypothetical protein
MPITPDPPFPKEKGHPLRSKDWNQLVNEVRRLDTDKANRRDREFLQGPLSIGGSLGIGIGNTVPKAPLHIAGGNWDVANSEGDLRIGSDTLRLKIGVALGGGGAGDVRIRASGGTNRLMIGSGNDDTLTIQNGVVGIGTATPNTSAKLDLQGSLFVGGSLAIQGTNGFHSARHTDDNRYGYFEGRTLSGQRGFYLGWGSPGSYVDFRMEGGSSLAITGGRVGIGLNNPEVPLDVSGEIRTNVGLISDRPHGNAYVSFSHRDQGNAGGYALLQHNNGTTYLNAAAGRSLFLRINNATQMTVNAGTISVANDFTIGGRLFVSNIPFGDKRNMQWDSDSKLFYYDNSSRRHKENIQDLEDDFSKILEAVPKTYTRPGNPVDWEIGYIAEEFHDLGLTRLVQYESEAVPDAINYRKVCIYLLEVLKQHHQKLTELEAKLPS